MPERRPPKTRSFTVGVASVSIASTGLQLLVWVPVALSASPEYSFRPMSVAPILLLTLVVGTVPGALIGLGQLLFSPRRYGLISLAVACLPYLSLQFTTWLLLDLRGIRFAD